jgi:hypothetical protein
MNIEQRYIGEYLDHVCECGAHVELIITAGSEGLPNVAASCRECGTQKTFVLTCARLGAPLMAPAGP